MYFSQLKTFVLTFSTGVPSPHQVTSQQTFLFSKSLQDVFMTSSRRLGRKKKRYIEDVFKTSLRRFQYVFTKTNVCCAVPVQSFTYIHILYDWDFFKISLKLIMMFFERFIFELEAFSYIRMGLSLAMQMISPPKMYSISIFVSPVCAPLIPCHYYWNGW